MKNASLVDVFRYIRQNSDYTFVYDSDADENGFAGHEECSDRRDFGAMF